MLRSQSRQSGPQHFRPQPGTEGLGNSGESLVAQAGLQSAEALISQDARLVQIVQKQLGSRLIHLLSQSGHGVLQKGGGPHGHPHNADISSAAPAGFHTESPGRGKAGLDHIVDLAGCAAEAAGQLAALELHGILAGELVGDELGDEIGQFHGDSLLQNI